MEIEQSLDDQASDAPADDVDVKAPADGTASHTAPIATSAERLGEDDLDAAFAEIAGGLEAAASEPSTAEPAPTYVGGGGLVDESDLEAAYAEVCQSDAAIPDLDDGFIDDETAIREPGSSKPSDSGATRAPQKQGSKRKLQFKIGKDAKIPPPPPPGLAAPGARVDRAASIAEIPTPPTLKRVFRFVDAALDVVNRPVRNMEEGRRGILGAAAVTTVIVSVAAMVLLPILFPRRTPITSLRERYDRLVETRVDDGPATTSPETEAD